MTPSPASLTPRQTTIPDHYPDPPRILAANGVCGACGTRGAMPGVIHPDHPVLLAMQAWRGRGAPSPATLTPEAPDPPTTTAGTVANLSRRVRALAAQLPLFGAEALVYRPGAPPPPSPVSEPSPATLDTLTDATATAVMLTAARTAPPPPGALPRGRYRGDRDTATMAHLCPACTRRVVAALKHAGAPIPAGYGWAERAP